MNNEPVAYAWCKNGKMLSAMIGKYEPIKTDPYWLENGFDAIPLYTHPADLTDEEIKDFIYPQFVFENGGIGMPLDEFLATVRAILRKAQEK